MTGGTMAMIRVQAGRPDPPGVAFTLRVRESGRYAARMSYQISSRHRLAWPPRLLLLCAWMALVWMTIPLPAQAMSCCPSGMAAEMMSTAQMAGTGHGGMASMAGKNSRSGHVEMPAGVDPGHGGLATHAGCPLCAGAAFLDSRLAQPPDRRSAGGILWTDQAARSAPDGDWRRRFRPPALV